MHKWIGCFTSAWFCKWWKVVTMINMQMVELMKGMWNHGDKWVVIENMVWEEGVYKCTLMQGQMGKDGGWIQKSFVLWGHTI